VLDLGNTFSWKLSAERNATWKSQMERCTQTVLQMLDGATTTKQILTKFRVGC